MPPLVNPIRRILTSPEDVLLAMDNGKLVQCQLSDTIYCVSASRSIANEFAVQIICGAWLIGGLVFIEEEYRHA